MVAPVLTEEEKANFFAGIEIRTRLSRRKATYGRYFAKGVLKRMFTRSGAPVSFSTEEEDDQHLFVVARSTAPTGTDGSSEPISTRVQIVGEPSGLVRCIASAPSRAALDERLCHHAVLYAAGLAMTWEWVKALSLEVPAEMARPLRAIEHRRKLVLERIEYVEVEGARRANLRLSVLP